MIKHKSFQHVLLGFSLNNIVCKFIMLQLKSTSASWVDIFRIQCSHIDGMKDVYLVKTPDFAFHFPFPVQESDRYYLIPHKTVFLSLQICCSSVKPALALLSHMFYISDVVQIDPLLLTFSFSYSEYFVFKVFQDDFHGDSV